MSLDLGQFFPPGARVLALPNWRHPRLYLLARRFSRRWEESAFYPASRRQARLYRLGLRIAATAGLAETRTIRSDDWPLGEFTEEVMPRLSYVGGVLATRIGAAPKAVVRLRDEEGRVLGYLKHAEQETARKRLRHEHRVLCALPEGLGPKPLKYGTLGRGEALLMSPVAGSLLPTTLPPGDSVVDYSLSLACSPAVSVEEHPWVLGTRRKLEERGVWLEGCFEALENRRWPIAIQHGDFAPWNMLQKPGGAIKAFDWEYGTPEGFPGLDLAYYILQISALIYRWTPEKAARYAIGYLTGDPRTALSHREAWAIVCLTSFDAYHKYLEDGQPPNTDLQTWRRRIWEGMSCGA